jgi:hypothetical protein
MLLSCVIYYIAQLFYLEIFYEKMVKEMSTMSFFEVTYIDNNFHCNFKQKRDCFVKIQNYINSKETSRICAVYGLRRTGKTTLLRQAAEALLPSDKDRAVFIECYSDTDFYEVVEFIRKKINEGFIYFFIDEVTYASSFESIATILSDKFVSVNNAKIVVTGTNSLGLYLLSQDKMYDRMELVNTTYTSYPEYSRLTGITGMDEYISKGSTLNPNIFKDKISTDSFVETAIVENIICSLKKYEDINKYPSLLTEKYSDEAIKSEIERIVNRYSQVRTYRAITKQFKAMMVSSAKELLFKDNPDVVLNVKYDYVNNKIASALGCHEKSNIEDKDINKIYEYLFNIGVFQSIPVLDSYENKVREQDLEMFVHAGMFHANMKYSLEVLQKDNSWINTDEKGRNIFLQKAYESALGEIMENIIISDIYYILCCRKGEIRSVNVKENLFDINFRWYVSKLNKVIDGVSHEADIVIVDKYKKESYLFEIKHSKKSVKEQSRHLEDKAFCNYVDLHFGKLKSRVVLYNGVGDVSSIIPRLPATAFLNQVYNDFDKNDFSLDETIKKVYNSVPISNESKYFKNEKSVLNNLDDEINDEYEIEF